MVISMDRKICKGCGQDKPLSEFSHMYWYGRDQGRVKRADKCDDCRRSGRYKPRSEPIGPRARKDWATAVSYTQFAVDEFFARYCALPYERPDLIKEWCAILGDARLKAGEPGNNLSRYTGRELKAKQDRIKLINKRRGGDV